MVYNGNALSSMALVKEQIMLNGGVFTSMALGESDFLRFVDFKAAADGVFTAAQDIPTGANGRMHAVFCYGWWDSPRSVSDGYWLCKNRWARFQRRCELSICHDIMPYMLPYRRVYSRRPTCKLRATCTHM